LLAEKNPRDVDNGENDGNRDDGRLQIENRLASFFHRVPNLCDCSLASSVHLARNLRFTLSLST
jgi:hypothetical protein